MRSICNYVPNKKKFSWVQNISFSLIHHVLSNLIFTSPIFPFTHHRNLILHPHPMQTMHHLPTPNTILTNHTPLIKSPYQPPTLNVNVEPQHNTFPITLHNTHVEPSPLSILSTPIVAHDQIPQPTPIFPTCLQPPPKTFCPTNGHQFTLQGLTHHQCS